MGVKENVNALKDLENAWNKGNWKKVWAAHTKDVIVSGPHLPAATKGLDEHRKDIEGLIAAFPDMKNTTTIAFGQGDWVASEGFMEGTHKGPLAGPGGQMIPATHKRIHLLYCELDRFESGKIAEERIYFDLAGWMMQLGVVPSP